MKLYGIAHIKDATFKNFFFNVYLFLGQRETGHEWGRGRERETQNQKQALSCQHRARRGARIHGP